MIVYNNMTHQIEDINPSDFNAVRHIASQHWSKRQRLEVIDGLFQVGETLANYLVCSTSNRVNLYKIALTKMVNGVLPFNLKVLVVLLKDVEWEMKWRTT